MAGSALCSEDGTQETDQVQNVVDFDGIEVEIIDDAQITQEFVESGSCSSGSNNPNNEVDDEEGVDHPTNLEDQLPSSLNVEAAPTVTGSSLAVVSAAGSTLTDTIYHQLEVVEYNGVDDDDDDDDDDEVEEEEATNVEELSSSLNVEPPTVITVSTSPTLTDTIEHQLEDASIEPQPEAGEISQANNEEANSEHPPTSSPLNEELRSAGESNEPLLLHPAAGSSNGDMFSLESLLGMAETEIPIPSPDFFNPDHELPDIDQAYPLPTDESLNVLMQIGDPVANQSVHFEDQANTCNVHDQPQYFNLDDDQIMNMLSTDQFIENFIRSMNQSEQQILFQSSFPQSSPPILNQLEPATSFPSYHNVSYNGGFQPFRRPQTSYHQTAGASSRFDSNNFVLPRALTPIRPQTNEHQLGETPIIDSRISSNYMPPRSNVPVFRPQFQRANAIPRTPIGTNMHFQYPVQPQRQLAMPSHLRPQQHVPSQQLNQAQAAPGSYNGPQAFQTIFTDQPMSMMQQRTKGWMSPSFNQVQYIIQNTNFSNRPQGLSRAVRPTPSNIAPRSAISSSVITSLPIMPEAMGFDHSSGGPNYQIRTTSSNNNQQVMFGEQGNLGRRSFGIGESSSSPFKRFRRDLVTVEASNQNEQRTYQSDLQNNGGLDVPQHSWNSGPMKNSLYDPRFEGIGLPIDPHLRGMDFNFIIQGRYV